MAIHSDDRYTLQKAIDLTRSQLNGRRSRNTAPGDRAHGVVEPGNDDSQRSRRAQIDHEARARVVVAPFSIMNGNPLIVDGHHCAFRRVAVKGDVRSNLHAGGKLAKATITDGMFLVGIDIVGSKLMEINVFSPGGLGSAAKFEKVDFSHAVIAARERKAKVRKQNGAALTNRQARCCKSSRGRWPGRPDCWILSFASERGGRQRDGGGERLGIHRPATTAASG